MDPDTALEKQIEFYRKMTGEERLSLALEMYELSCEVAREGIRMQHPEANETQVEEFLRQRLQLEWFKNSAKQQTRISCLS